MGRVYARFLTIVLGVGVCWMAFTFESWLLGLLGFVVLYYGLRGSFSSSRESAEIVLLEKQHHPRPATKVRLAMEAVLGGKLSENAGDADCVGTFQVTEFELLATTKEVAMGVAFFNRRAPFDPRWRDCIGESRGQTEKHYPVALAEAAAAGHNAVTSLRAESKTKEVKLGDLTARLAAELADENTLAAAVFNYPLFAPATKDLWPSVRASSTPLRALFHHTYPEEADAAADQAGTGKTGADRGSKEGMNGSLLFLLERTHRPRPLEEVVPCLEKVMGGRLARKEGTDPGAIGSLILEGTAVGAKSEDLFINVRFHDDQLGDIENWGDFLRQASRRDRNFPVVSAMKALKEGVCVELKAMSLGGRSEREVECCLVRLAAELAGPDSLALATWKPPAVAPITDSLVESMRSRYAQYAQMFAHTYAEGDDTASMMADMGRMLDERRQEDGQIAVLILLQKDVRTVSIAKAISAVEKAWGSHLRACEPGDEGREVEGVDGIARPAEADSILLLAPEGGFLIRPVPGRLPERDISGIAAPAQQVYRDYKACIGICTTGKLLYAELISAYHMISLLAAELADADTIGVVHGESNEIRPVTAGVWGDVRGSRRPTEVLFLAPYDYMADVPADDEQLNEQCKIAKSRWTEFLTAVREPQPGQDLFVRLAYQEGDIHEFMWARLRSLGEDTVEGEITSHPANIRKIKHGDTVTAKVKDVDDWLIKRGSEITGGYTAKVLRVPSKG